MKRLSDFEVASVTVQAEFRFYAELNDFLGPERRHRSFVYECARRATLATPPMIGSCNDHVLALDEEAREP